MTEFQSRRYEGKVALITGGGSGIGRAIAMRLAGEGANIVLFDLDASALTETAEVISATGPAVTTVVPEMAIRGAERRAGKLVQLHVRSLAGESTRVRAEGLNQLLSAAGEVPGIRLIGNNEAILELAAGEEVLLIADAALEALAPVVADSPAEVGFFGLKSIKEE